MKRLLSPLTVACLLAAAVPAHAGPYSAMYVFGDSLSDAGQFPDADGPAGATVRFTNREGPTYLDGSGEIFGSTSPMLIGAMLGLGLQTPSTSSVFEANGWEDGNNWAVGGYRTDEILNSITAPGGSVAGTRTRDGGGGHKAREIEAGVAQAHHSPGDIAKDDDDVFHDARRMQAGADEYNAEEREAGKADDQHARHQDDDGIHHFGSARHAEKGGQATAETDDAHQYQQDERAAYDAGIVHAAPGEEGQEHGTGNRGLQVVGMPGLQQVLAECRQIHVSHDVPVVGVRFGCCAGPARRVSWQSCCLPVPAHHRPG